ncbi:hypothetical protein FHX52_0819 [Humibacillus xanthopallidus]|uniref:Uncharacterized protein n=1 Tax=Humibacillus xanthopallidus TaxID=412689 RepID=A0A543PUE9_9MICO|nr:hypothetical protein [Humibacillus xanthopallidus]TQN47708.1 hypothetical protein FHX52_0819 [Humibacillus xanthopallidus]
MPFDIALAAAALAAATQGVTLFDKIADQVVRFKTKRPLAGEPPQHRMTIEESDGELVSKVHGHEVERITARDLVHLDADVLRHIKVYEESMQNNYTLWEKVYPQLPLSPPMERARLELQLAQVTDAIGADLKHILDFLEDAGLGLDDHYRYARDLLAPTTD